MVVMTEATAVQQPYKDSSYGTEGWWRWASEKQCRIVYTTVKPPRQLDEGPLWNSVLATMVEWTKVA